jgi:hypothetical protein
MDGHENALATHSSAFFRKRGGAQRLENYKEVLSERPNDSRHRVEQYVLAGSHHDFLAPFALLHVCLYVVVSTMYCSASDLVGAYLDERGPTQSLHPQHYDRRINTSDPWSQQRDTCCPRDDTDWSINLWAGPTLC